MFLSCTFHCLEESLPCCSARLTSKLGNRWKEEATTVTGGSNTSERVSGAPQTDPGLPKPGNHPGPNKTTCNSLLWLVCSHVLGRQRGSSQGLWKKRTITRRFHSSRDWKRARSPHWANVDPPFLLHVVTTIAVTMGQGTGRWLPKMGQ